MKKFFKSLILGLSLVALNLQAADVSVNVANAVATNLLTGQIQLEEIEVINNGGSTVTVRIYDAPSTNVTWTNSQYSVPTSYTTNLVTVFTNYNGILTTNTNTVLYTVNTTVSAAPVNYRLLKSFTIAAGASSTWTPVNGVYLSYGLMATNNVTNTTYNYTYSNIR